VYCAVVVEGQHDGRARSRRQHGRDSMRSKSIAAPVNLSTIGRSPPPRDWTPRSPSSSRQPEDGLRATGPFDLSRTPAASLLDLSSVPLGKLSPGPRIAFSGCALRPPSGARQAAWTAIAGRWQPSLSRWRVGSAQTADGPLWGTERAPRREVVRGNHARRGQQCARATQRCVRVTVRSTNTNGEAWASCGRPSARTAAPSGSRRS
jgi:hypothetical protein